jgi:hypothetical protein
LNFWKDLRYSVLNLLKRLGELSLLGVFSFQFLERLGVFSFEFMERLGLYSFEISERLGDLVLYL